ncbi:MAG: lipid-A-disaccharide synthase [Hoeflea sp.]|uniref:lipid-A-disaccharide synthase n=1 Tax=Hoeflea sp. TaxID=1940281 RepID=UPI001D6EF9B4|nr:lipid-A-disaccharide synthase [Hoeflea sp.]MBU4529642.1 lipid-A-disaccharide synthase [Alphaproteobacteria bacterium]MBU4546761.1 lipid-A-disaccharide synthase [Alphaproteobacteria bacterium]MBU4551029.1 lipid-A-disaccharide synthase [Alphaproteobacteria bacterium]MBV1723971.1 lipid-A-disaccharide synthase [Hoeflea sp.]MBV1763248.1 lipid-A-disaccharide synthase [Hoeflea sp.]
MTALRLAVVAGEPSGDILGGELVRALATATGEQPVLIGVGGEHLIAQGLNSLFDYTELSIIGFSAVIKQLPKLILRIRQTADAIIAARPDCLVIIDSPDFSHRVARKVRAALPDLKIINYVCPTVWAWKPERAPAMNAYVDHVLSIFPFEPEIVARLGGPPLTYVGHRLMDDPGLVAAHAAQAARRSSGQSSAPPVCLILPGSRSGEVARLGREFGEAARVLKQINPAMSFVLPAGGNVERQVRDEALAWDVTCRIVTGDAAKWEAFGQADVAIAASGTVLLELALAGVPHISSYRLDPIARLMSRKITIWTAALPNMIAGHVVVPEYYDAQVRAARLARDADQLARDTLYRAAMLKDLDLVWSRMQTGEPASELAARTLLCVIGR